MEKDNVFGQGTRTTVAVAILVKNPKQQTPGNLYYYDIGDYLSREQKLAKVDGFGSLARIPWTKLDPSPEGDWLGKRSTSFARFPAIAVKDKNSRETSVFTTYSHGLVTSRDAWVYNYSTSELVENVRRLIENYNAEVDRWLSADRDSIEPKDFVSTDSTRLNWSRDLLARLQSGRAAKFDPSAVGREVMYRPFSKQLAYYDPVLNTRNGKLGVVFPRRDDDNLGVYIVGMSSAVPFSAIMLNLIPDLHVTGAGSGGQFFPRYTYRAIDSDPSALFQRTVP